MKFQDYYEILGVSRGADAEAIKRAYRKLAMKWHPDRHQGDARASAEAQFKLVNEAYEVLSDPEKRKKYDRFGENWKHGEEFAPPRDGARAMSPEEFAAAFGGGSGFSDFFTSMFGEQVREAFQGRAARHARYRIRGADVHGELRLPVGVAIAGGKHRFELPTRSACPRCGGVGFVEQRVCPTCAGVGAVTGRREVELAVPANVRDGLVLRLRGLGEPGIEGGETGDLHLTIRLESDRTYRLSGNDLEADVAVAPWEALRGAKVDVRTPGGTLVVTIPAGTKAGARLRLRGKGLEDGTGGRGDFQVVVRLALPEELTERQKQLLVELAEAGPREVRGGARVGGRP